MPTPAKFRLTLAHLHAPYLIESFEFEAFPTASCTLAQHTAAKAWYKMQETLESPKEPNETRKFIVPKDQ